MAINLRVLPYEVMSLVVLQLCQPDLLTLRQTCQEYAMLANAILFKTLDINKRHSYKPELVSKYGGLVRCLGVVGVDGNNISYPRLISGCFDLREIIINKADVDEEVILAMVNQYPCLRTFKVCLSAHRQLSGNLTMWSHLSNLQNLKTLHLNYVDHRVAENLFYALPRLCDFRAKLVSEDSSDCVVLENFKENFYNPYLTHLHIESWVKGLEIDRHLFVVKPENFPCLTSLSLVAYQTPTQTWFHYSWHQLRHAEVDFIRCNEDADSVVLNCPNLISFHCMMWSASGKLLDQLLTSLTLLNDLHIESSLSQTVFQELSPAPRIKNLQIGVVKFTTETLIQLNNTFPGAKAVQLGHCKSEPSIAEDIRDCSLSLPWTSLSVFQLNPVVAAISSKAPYLTQITYDLASKLCDAVKFRKMAVYSPSSILKVSKKVEPVLYL